MPALPTRIEIRVIEPCVVDLPTPKPFAREMATARRSMARCGPWPRSADLDTYLDAIDQAGLELHRLALLQERFWRRYGVAVDDNRLLAAKWRSRHGVVRQLFEQRVECLRLLKEPEGSA